MEEKSLPCYLDIRAMVASSYHSHPRIQSCLRYIVNREEGGRRKANAMVFIMVLLFTKMQKVKEKKTVGAKYHPTTRR